MKLKSIFSTLFLGAFLFVAAPTFAQQAPMFFDEFLFDNAGQPQENYNGFFQFIVTDGSVDLVGGNVPGALQPPLGRFVDLGGSTGDPGRFATRAPFLFTAGTTYNLSFLYKSSGGETNQATATIGTKVFTVSTSSEEFQQFSQNFSFSETTVSDLAFQDAGLGDVNQGIGIDRVILSVVANNNGGNGGGNGNGNGGNNGNGNGGNNGGGNGKGNNGNGNGNGGGNGSNGQGGGRGNQ